MTAMFLKVLAALHLEYRDFVVTTMTQYRGHHCGTRYKRCAKAKVVTVGYGQNIGKLDLLSDVALRRIRAFNVSPVATRYCLPPDLITAYIATPS